MKLEMNFAGKAALITGAASGMGLLTAQLLAEDGASVALVDVNAGTLDARVQEITQKGGRAIGLTCDVRDYEQVKATYEKALEAFGRVDILINCAGGTAKRMLNSNEPTFEETPIEVFDWGLDVNLKGPFYFSHVAMKYMKEQKSGVIILLGSITGLEGDPRGMDYPVAKSGLMNGLVRSLAQAGGEYGVRACCVAPGPVLTRAAMANMKTLIGRAAEPIEIVNLILYLASDHAACVTGTTYLIDGGRNVMFNK